MYVLAPDQIVSIYPYSIGDLKRDNPNTSFPSEFTATLLAEWNVFPVEKQPAPFYDPATQNLNQGNPVFQNGKWLMTWQVTPATAAQIQERKKGNANYVSFWNTLMTSAVYTAIREQAFVSLPMNTLITEFIALMGDAKAGRPSEPAIQQSIDAILATGTFTADHLTELQTALAAGHLDGVYTLPAPTLP
jgi:hypothetical protein